MKTVVEGCADAGSGSTEGFLRIPEETLGPNGAESRITAALARYPFTSAIFQATKVAAERHTDDDR